MRVRIVVSPAMGRPTRATLPNLSSLSDSFLPLDVPLRIARYFYAIDALPVGAIDFENPAVLLHHRSDGRHAAERREDEAGHGLVVLPFQIGVEFVFEHVDTKKAVD